MPQSKAYVQFMNAAPYLIGFDPTFQYQVQGQRRGFTTNYQVYDPDSEGWALWLDAGSMLADGAVPDPFPGHGAGNPSDYLGGWLDVFHGVEVLNNQIGGQLWGGEFHSDAFSPLGPFVPIHLIDVAASYLLPASSWQQFTCSVSGGCH